MTGWLIDTLIATTLLMALVLLVREPVRRQFGPAVAYGLWLVPALRLVMPPLTWTVERAAPLAPAPVQPGQSALAPTAAPGLVEQLGGWEALAVAAWLAGACAMLVAGSLLYRWQRRAVLRDSVQLARLGAIRIVRSGAVRGPMAFGILDRVIALPIDFDDRFDPEERRLAFDHELSAPPLGRPHRQPFRIRPAVPAVVQSRGLAVPRSLPLRPGSGVRRAGAGQGQRR